MSDSLAAVAQFVSRTFEPFTTALETDGGLLEYVRKLGWRLPALPQALTDVRTSGAHTVTALAGFERQIRLQEDGTGSGDDLAQAALDLLQALAALSSAIRELPDGLKKQLPQAFIDGTHMAEQLLTRLFNDTLSRRLEKDAHGLYRLAQVLGFIETIEHNEDQAAFQPAYQERTIRWDRLTLLASGPAALARDVYGWGTPQLDARKLFLALRDLSFAILSPGSFDFPSPALLKAIIPGLPPDALAEPGLVIPLLSDTPIAVSLSCLPLPTMTANEQQGLVFTLSGHAAIAQSVDITPELKFELDGQIDLAAGVALALWPDRAPRLIGNAGSGSPVALTDANVTLRFRYTPPDADQGLSLASFAGLQLDARGAVVEAGFGVTAQAGVDLRMKAALPGLRLQVGGLGQDSFLGEVLPESASLEIDFGLGWSLASGFAWANGAGPKIRIPIAKSIGPVRLDAVDVQLDAPDDSWEIRLGLTASTNLGPVAAQIQGIGFSLKVNTAGGNFGLFGLSGSVAPPEGVGLSIEAPGLTGGGFFSHDAALGQYAGVMQLSLQDQLTLKAFGLIATRMPDGSRGYSLLVFITAEDFRPVPLGLGFTLQAIGGMLAVNRTFDQDVLRAGLKNDTLGTLLFPRDPVGNAPALIAALGAAFPARRGSYLLGLLVRIGWMTPTLVQIDLALVLEFGARRRLLALGRISSILPTRDNDLVRLNLDALGVLDFDAGTLAVDAVLVDSRLAQRFPIIGSAALRAGWSANADFVLTAGGFNPHFVAPVGLPRQERLAIVLAAGDNPRLTCEAYWAITADTYQFGARAHAYAEALGFAVEGDVGFDVLVVPVPLHFIADFHASVQLKRGSHNLFKVGLDGELEGPRPLRLSGKASFEIFWCSFSVRFDTTLLEGEPPPPPPAVDVTAELIKALSTAQSWSTELTGEHTHGVALRRLAPGPALVLDPLGRISVKQQVVPLNTGRDIERFGGAPLAGARRFHVSAMLNGQPQDAGPLQAGFAPAQYFEMSDDEKLAAPAFENMDAGLVFGAEKAQFNAAAMVGAPLQYEQILIDAPGQTPQPGAVASTRVPLPVSQLQVQSGAAARTPLRGVGSRRFANTAAPAAARITAVRWSIAALTDGAPPPVAPDVRSWSEYRATLAALNRGGARWQMVPRHELNP